MNHSPGRGGTSSLPVRWTSFPRVGCEEGLIKTGMYSNEACVNSFGQLDLGSGLD